MTALLAILATSLLLNILCVCALLIRTDGRAAFERQQSAMRRERS